MIIEVQYEKHYLTQLTIKVFNLEDSSTFLNLVFRLIDDFSIFIPPCLFHPDFIIHKCHYLIKKERSIIKYTC